MRQRIEDIQDALVVVRELPHPYRWLLCRSLVPTYNRWLNIAVLLREPYWAKHDAMARLYGKF